MTNSRAKTDHDITIKTVDEDISSDTTLQNDDILFHAIAANEVWEAYGYLYVVAGAGALKHTVIVPSGAVGRWREHEAEIAFATTETESGTVFVKIHIICINSSTPGTIQYQFAQNSSNGADTTVSAGSYLIWTKLS